MKSTFDNGRRVRCSIGPKRSLMRVFFSLKSPFLRVVSVTFLAYNVAQVAVISGWNGSYGSMGPEGHIRHLDLVMEVLTGAQCGSKTIA